MHYPQIYIVHDLRKWNGSDAPTRNPLAAAWVAGGYRVGLHAHRVRTWCLAWSVPDPTQCFAVRCPPDEAPYRGKTRNLDPEDLLLELPVAMPAAAWAWFLGLAAPWSPPKAPRVESTPPEGREGQFRPSTGLGQTRIDGPPEPLRPAGTLVPPSAPVPSVGRVPTDRDELRHALLRRYLELAGWPSPKVWDRKLPPVVPKTAIEQAFDWTWLGHVNYSSRMQPTQETKKGPPDAGSTGS